MTEAEAISKADKYLKEEDFEIEDIEKVIEVLKGSFLFKLARRVLNKAINYYPKNIWLKQQLVLCTYKDVDLPPSFRLSEAVKILDGMRLRDPSNKDAKTLALGGAVYKKMWKYYGRIDYLYDALSFFRAAYERNPKEDRGYGGVNAAYILQLLARRALKGSKQTGTFPPEAEYFERQADKLKEALVKTLEGLLKEDPSLADDYWFVINLAGVYLGLCYYENADKWLNKSMYINVPERTRYTAFRQLISIIRLHGIRSPKEDIKVEWWSEPWKVLANVSGKWSKKALCYSPGKVGLALTGSGFSASFYHIGVLARLAEMNILRSVEVLSTVSGGSIIGTYYYLELKNLLENKPDEEITRDDYIQIIKRMQLHFLEGVQKNLRARSVSNFIKNLNTVFSKSYGRCNIIGELYEDILFSKVPDNHPKGHPRYMHDLIIKPKWENEDFNPDYCNWHHGAKVPVLLINTTCLNTGHAWQFTARSMGEPPGLLGRHVDKNSRYRRIWYNEAPSKEYESYRLGYAVAASACLPGLFDPLLLKGLYPDIDVHLVDGGLYDSQGISGLLDEKCSFMLCSDASGHMEEKGKLSDSFPSILIRSNNILIDRNREMGYLDLYSRLDSNALKGLFFVHLKKDLMPRPQDWENCQDPTPDNEKEEIQTPYGIDPEIQRLIANLRMDLDSFTEVEAYALMCSGYLMAEQEFGKIYEEYERIGELGMWESFEMNAPRQKWNFLDLEPILKSRDKTNKARKDLEKQLRVGSSKIFKTWQLDCKLKIVSLATIFALLLLFPKYIGPYLGKSLISFSFTIRDLFIVIGIILILVLLAIRRLFFPEKAGFSILYRFFGYFFRCIGAKINLYFLNDLFLNRGKVDKLLKKWRG